MLIYGKISFSQVVGKYVTEGVVYNRYLELLKGHKFRYTSGRLYLGLDEAVESKGVYRVLNDTIALFSNKHPQGKPLWHKEFWNPNIPPDSIRLRIINKTEYGCYDGIIRVNNRYLRFSPAALDTSTFMINRAESIRYIIIECFSQPYPILSDFSAKVNDIILELYDQKKTSLFDFVYDQRFLVRGDTLYELHDDRTPIKFVRLRFQKGN